MFLQGWVLVAVVPAQEPARPSRDLNGYFPFQPVANAEAWAARRQEIEQRLRLSAGLLPMPERTPLNAVIHGRVEREDYTIDRVFFESLPGHFVTGSLYLPKSRPARMPGILCPYGHWPEGRFMDLGAGTEAMRKQIETKAEQLESAARSPLQARCVQLARMGCAVFHYDMLGYADSIQFPQHRHGARAEGFVSPGADLRLQTYFGLQTWNSLRAFDFLAGLDGVDPERIGCTGASGGGTQTMMLTGLDPRIRAAFPCVMVSTSMQGGCTCENAHHLRIGQGNIDLAALTAPRPLGLTAADDWTKELVTKGLPDLQGLYAQLGVPDLVTAHVATQFPHNYNLPSRLAMYAFFNRHFRLGLQEPIRERDFVFASREELTVWTAEHPAPRGDAVGLAHEKAVCAWLAAQDARAQQAPDFPDTARRAWKLMVGREAPPADAVAYEQVAKEVRSDHVRVDARISHRGAGEVIEAVFLQPRQWNGEAVLWLSLKGPESVVGADGPTAAARKLLQAGTAIACPRLYLQGATEQPRAGDNLKAKPGDFREFSGYTYGYNPTLLARRVHDAQTLLTMMRNQADYPVRQLRVVGVDGAALIALVTAVVTPVDGVEADLQGFRFANLSSPWDVHFMPGAVKYGDVEMLRRLVERP